MSRKHEPTRNIASTRYRPIGGRRGAIYCARVASPNQLQGAMEVRPYINQHRELRRRASASDARDSATASLG